MSSVPGSAADAVDQQQAQPAQQPQLPTSLRLFVDPPCWGLPSATSDSLEALLYARLTGFPLEVIQSRYPYHPATDSLPAATYGSLILADRQIIPWLKENWCDLDKPRSRKERGTIHAIRELVTGSLTQVLLAMQWADPKSEAVMRRLSAPAAPAMLRMFFASQEAKRQTQKLTLTSKEEALAEARRVYTSLADILDEKDFFFGDYPTSADAVVAAHLAVHLSLELDGEKPLLRELLLREFPSLGRLCWTVCREAGVLGSMTQVRGLFGAAQDEAKDAADPQQPQQQHKQKQYQPQLPRPQWRKREPPALPADARQWQPKAVDPASTTVVHKAKQSSKELLVFGGVCLAMWMVYRAAAPRRL